ncbi:MAG: alpha/beta hydrolase [Acidobacteriota bacterium]|nr:alpha/beta hydrolase [Acidobacteriota bacterium]
MTRTFYQKIIIVSFLLAVSSVSLAQQSVKNGFVKTSGGKLYYEVAGKGEESLVMIHGGQMDRRIWDEQFALFAKNYKVIRYDVRGYGKTGAPAKVYSNVGELAELLRFLKVEKAYLMGLSLGGGISIDYALEHPEAVKGLILSAPGLSGYKYEQNEYGIIEAARDEGEAKATELWLKNPYMATAMENPAIENRIRRLCLENAFNWLTNPFLERPIKPPAIGRLAEIKVPILLIIGDKDVPDMQKIADKITADVKDVRKEVLAGAGHIANMEKPDEFNRLVLGFLKDRKINEQ